MAKSIDDFLIPNTEYIVDDFVCGGDHSRHNAQLDSISCYSVVGVTLKTSREMDSAIDSFLGERLGVEDPSQVEVHAKEIWNGSERAKGYFRGIRTKAEMKEFIFELSLLIKSHSPFVCTTTCHEDSLPDKIPLVQNSPKLRSTGIKRLLIYNALSRLNQNVKIVIGKDIGNPEFIMDREDDESAKPLDNEEDGSYGAFITDIALARPSDREADIKFYVQLEPRYTSSDSRRSRLIQVADLAAYFVGKFLSLYAVVMEELASGKPVFHVSSELMRDCNFCLAIIDNLNIEITMILVREQLSHQRCWMRGITEPYQKYIESGIDMVNCSVREAIISNKDRRARHCGIGYLIAL